MGRGGGNWAKNTISEKNAEIGENGLLRTPRFVNSPALSAPATQAMNDGRLTVCAFLDHSMKNVTDCCQKNYWQMEFKKIWNSVNSERSSPPWCIYYNFSRAFSLTPSKMASEFWNRKKSIDT